MWAPKLLTPGMARTCALIASVVRSMSATEVPGADTQCISRSGSLKAGNRDWPSRGAVTAPRAVTATAATKAPRGRWTMRASTRE